MSPHELQTIGLSEKEARIFRFMLDSAVDGLKLTEIAHTLDLNTKNCSSYLKNMERKGFVRAVKKQGNRTRFFPADPMKMQDKLDLEIQQLKKKQNILQKMTNRYYQNRILKVDLFEGKEDHEMLREMIKNLKTKVYVIDNKDERWYEPTKNPVVIKRQSINITTSKHGERVNKASLSTTYQLPPSIKIHGELLVAEDMIIITQPSDKYIGAMITHRQTADNLRAIFELALPEAEKLAEKHSEE